MDLHWLYSAFRSLRGRQLEAESIARYSYHYSLMISEKFTPSVSP
jgi:hypothetical protein